MKQDDLLTMGIPPLSSKLIALFYNKDQNKLATSQHLQELV